MGHPAVRVFRRARHTMRQKLLPRIHCGVAFVLLLGTVTLAHAQWQMQTSGTSASLRGIHAVDAMDAWASGAGGTIVRTEDGGQHWQACSVPQGAEKLDFRSIWAWDTQHAMVMSSGPGDQSRLYSTHDGCRTWRLVFTNPDADGFWDGLQFDGTRFGVVLGDPVHGSFTLFATYDGGSHWTRQLDPCLRTMEAQQGAFAASNQSMAVLPIRKVGDPAGSATDHQVWFGASGGWLYSLQLTPLRMIDAQSGCVHLQPLSALHGDGAGIFSVAFHDGDNGVAVGGDYTKPQSGADSAAYTTDGKVWHVAQGPPLGYCSTVAWNAGEQVWIAAGPTGSDISHDGGRTWKPLDRGNWNALGLPFIVGPDGRIARLISWGQLRANNGVPGNKLRRLR